MFKIVLFYVTFGIGIEKKARGNSTQFMIQSSCEDIKEKKEATKKTVCKHVNKMSVENDN